MAGLIYRSNGFASNRDALPAPAHSRCDFDLRYRLSRSAALQSSVPYSASSDADPNTDAEPDAHTPS
jgi:hypothetical protein